MKFRGRKIAAATAGVFALTGLTQFGTVNTAGAEGTKAPGPAVASAPSWQDSVGRLTNQLWQVGGSDKLFSGVALDDATKSVIVYRKGDAASTLYAPALNSMPKQRVVFRASLLSGQETMRAMAAVDGMAKQFAAQGLQVESTSTDFKGPVVVHTSQRPGAALRATAMSVSASAASNLAGVAAGAVTIVGDGHAATLDNRWADVSPFWGGNGLAMHGHGLCSGGFTGVSSANHKHYMITAAHCIPSDHNFYAGSTSGPFIGKVSTADTRHDLAFIPTAATAPKIYSGINGDAEANIQITGAVHPAAGQHICTSGAMSERRCGDAIVFAFNHNVRTCEDPAHNVGCKTIDAWSAVSPGHHQVAAQGDSGGPVYTGSIFGPLAVGIISSGTNLVRCEHTRIPDPNVQCGSAVYFADAYTEIGINHKIDMSK